ncbi:hypothetical protein J6590_047716 [Homalodisca vitripennis]|nr:hypothetical protein J6590_047716 [Homalodisca vitripennis]
MKIRMIQGGFRKTSERQPFGLLIQAMSPCSAPHLSTRTTVLPPTSSHVNTLCLCCDTCGSFGAAGMATPTVFKSKLDGKVLKSQTLEVISNVMDFMSREGKEGTFVIDSKKVRERVATAVGVSQRTLTRISAEKRKLAETTTSFETPNKVRKVPKKGDWTR